MQLDALLEVAIGMVFVWLVLSIATLEVQNRITSWLNWRADFLENAIHDMLKDPQLVEKFYNHPLIQELSSKDKKGNFKRPDYIPNPVFATAALEVIMNAGKTGESIPVNSLSIDEMRTSMKALDDSNPALMRTVQHFFPNLDKGISNTDNAIATYRTNVENWFNNVMNKSSNAYKQRAQWIAFLIGLAIAIFFNVDTVNIAQKLWQDPTIREVLVAQAQNQSATNPPSSEILTQAQSLNFPIGWTTSPAQNQYCGLIGTENYQLVIKSGGECRVLTGLPPLNNGWGLFVKLFGYLLSGAAASQGAPFWFDILKKLVNIRTTTTTTTTQTSAPSPTTTTTTTPNPPSNDTTPPEPEAVG